MVCIIQGITQDKDSTHFYSLLKCYFACRNRTKLADLSKHSQNIPSSNLHNVYFLGRRQKRARIESNSLKNPLQSST